MTRMLLTAFLVLAMFGAEAQKTPAKSTTPKAPDAKTATPQPTPPKNDAPGENGMGDYENMELHWGTFYLSLDGTLKRIENGVKIRLIPADPAQPDLTIEAQVMTFSYKAGVKGPASIHMEGHVVIVHPQAEVRSEKADWDMEKNLLIFTGHPMVKSAQAEKPIEAERFEISLKDKGVKSTNGRYFGKPKDMFGGGDGSKPDTPGSTSGTMDMKTSDIKDWPAFMSKIKADATAEKTTPAKQLTTLLDPRMRDGIASATVDMLVKEKANVLKELNRVMAKPAFYTEAAWQGVTLNAETKTLLEQKTRTPEEQVRLNRLLLSAAYPDLVAAPPAPKPKE